MLYNAGDMITFAERLKELSEKRGLLQKAVASDLNIGNTTLSNYEQNVSSPNPEMLIAIADYFDTTVDYLLGRTDNPDPIGFAGERDNRLLQSFNALSDADKALITEFAAFLSYKSKGRR